MSSSVEQKTMLDTEPLSELTRRAIALYDAKIKVLVEPEQNGRGIAIHPDSGDYEVAPTPTQAGHLMRKRHPNSPFMTMTIGPEPDYALAGRYLAGLQSKSGKS